MDPQTAQIQNQPQSPQAIPGRSNGFAIASLILGLLSFTGIGAILAIIFGALGISKAGKYPGVGGKGMAITGLVLGIIGLVIFPYLMVVTSFGTAKEGARSDARDAKRKMDANMITAGVEIYRADNKEVPKSLDGLVPEYLDYIPSDPMTFSEYEYDYSDDCYAITAGLEGGNYFVCTAGECQNSLLKGSCK